MSRITVGASSSISVPSAPDAPTKVAVEIEKPAFDRPAREIDEKTRLLLEGPIVSTLIRLAWPNVLVMLTQSSTGLIEMWYISRLGVDALAGIALVTPALIFMQNMSQGAIGGGISSTIARALGAGQRERASGAMLHALIVALVLVRSRPQWCFYLADIFTVCSEELTARLMPR